MKQDKLPEISYDLESMTPAEESLFWSKFELMLQYSRDNGFARDVGNTAGDSTPDFVFTLIDRIFSANSLFQIEKWPHL